MFIAEHFFVLQLREYPLRARKFGQEQTISSSNDLKPKISGLVRYGRSRQTAKICAPTPHRVVASSWQKSIAALSAVELEQS
ncbi:hypothetical protein [Chamaesiphon sp.]|uniref:hypothetical protein n=1 Tax=Chamaesiphon sp. TaxID=2814140 RepID=UPI00359365F7